jgi:hypothetical protein
MLSRLLCLKAKQTQAMQRRNFPSILLFGFGLALALSLLFNGYLLYEQSHQRNLYEYELGTISHPTDLDLVFWQQQLSDCKRANQQKDSLIHRLEQAPNAPPEQAITAQHKLSK